MNETFNSIEGLMIANWRPVEADKAKLIMTRISGNFPTWTIAADGNSKPRNLADVFSNIGLQTINPANYQKLNKIRPVGGNPLTYSKIWGARTGGKFGFFDS